MRRTLWVVFLFMSFVWFTPRVGAQNLPAATATQAAQNATPSAQEATASAQTQPRVDERQDRDITQTTGQVKSRLAQTLDDNPIGQMNITNFLQHALRRAVDAGVPANVLVLLLLFPVIASFIAASRHLIGLEGFGVYAPAVLAVALLSTGILTGLFLFTTILLAAALSRSILKRMRLQYLPRTALLLLLVSLSVFGLMLVSPLLGRISIELVTVSIFPILVLILLTENFMEATLLGTDSRAVQLTLETIFLAVLSALFVRTQMVQDFVILHPEVTILAVFVLDMAVGQYTGLRVSEYFRFKPILDPEE